MYPDGVTAADRAKNSADVIAERLRTSIRRGELLPGTRLIQERLASDLNVSRIPLREALRTLVGEGLIIMKPGLGAVVTELDAGEVQELYGLRLQLEPPLAKDIIDHVRRRDLDDLTALAASMKGLGENDSAEWSTLNYRFHRRMYELSERRHAVRLVVQVLNLVEPYARVHAHVLGSRRDTQQEWDDVIEAMRTGDADRLERLIAEGISSARADLMSSMGPQPTQDLD
jgi:DNA-binding GntR family transcriptional regulator